MRDFAPTRRRRKTRGGRIKDDQLVYSSRFEKRGFTIANSSVTRIFVDADGCPVKEEIFKVAERCQVSVILVANKRLNIPVNPLFQMEVVGGGFDAADDWIFENAKLGDIVVTADILLADRCVKNRVSAVNPNGDEFTEDNIGSKVAGRELMQNLRHMGEMRGGPAPMDKKVRSKFLGTLDRVIQAAKRN